MTKGNDRQRVMLNNVLRKKLQKYVDSVCCTYSRNDAFIKSQKGSAFSPLTITQLFARLYKKTGIEGGNRPQFSRHSPAVFGTAFHTLPARAGY